MMRIMSRRSRKGTNIVEFAMTLPMFILVMFALVDFGWYFGGMSILDAAVTEGCRAASLVDPLLGDPEFTAETIMTDFLEAMPIVECGDGCVIDATIVGEIPAKSIQCTIVNESQPILGWVALPTHQATSALMRFEWQREQEF